MDTIKLWARNGDAVRAQSALRADSQRGSSGSFPTAPYQG
jgi:hypothetical protein